jgi:hypothetical protein
MELLLLELLADLQAGPSPILLVMPRSLLLFVDLQGGISLTELEIPKSTKVVERKADGCCRVLVLLTCDTIGCNDC